MDKEQDIANQTEIPVSEAPPIESVGKPNGMPLVERLKNIPVKFLALGGVAIIVVVGVILGSVLFLSPKSSQTNDPDINQIEEKVIQAINEGRLDEAEQLIDEGFEITKGGPEFAAQKINLISLKGNQNGTEQESFEESKPYIDASLEAYPEDTQILQAAGYAYETAGDYEKALELYDKGLALDPNSSELHFHRGHVLYFLGRFEEGKEAYNQSYSINQNNSQTLIALGNIAVIENDLEKAYGLFINASENSQLNQLKAEALTAASIVRRQQLNMEESLTLGKQAVELDPNYSTGLGNYGYILYINGSAVEGAEYITRAIEVNPRISQNYDYAARVLRLDGQYQEAISYQNQAISRIDNDNTIFGTEAKAETRAIYTYGLAKIYSSAGGNPGTMLLLQQAIISKPDLRDSLISDFQSGLFSELSDNPQFQALIT